MGMVFWEILCQDLPWNDIQAGRGPFLGRLLGEVESGRRPAIPPDTPPEYCKLVTDCWQLDPKLRPSFEQLATYEVFATIADET